MQPIQAAHSNLRHRLGSLNDEKRRLVNQIKELNQNYISQKHELDAIDKSIQDVAAKSGQTRQLELAREIEHKLEDINMCARKLEEYESTDAELRGERPLLNSQLSNLREAYGEIQQQHAQKRRMLDQIRRSKTDRILAYGENMPRLLSEIERSTNQFHRPPLGPIGLFVQLEDKKWSLPIESLIGKELEGFIVMDQHDHDLLRSMMRRFNINNSPIAIIKSDAPIDFKTGEPDSKFLTALRSLEISNKLVLKFFVIQTGIERAVFLPDRSSAKAVLRNRETNVDSSFTPHERVFVNGASHSSNVLFSTGKIGLICNDENRVKELEAAVRSFECQMKGSQSELDNLENKIKSLHIAGQKLEESKTQIMIKLKASKRQLQILENERDMQSSNGLNELERDKRSSQLALDTFQTQFVALSEQERNLNEQIERIESEIETNLKDQEEIRFQADQVMDNMNNTASFRRNVDKELSLLENSLKYTESEISVLTTGQERLRGELSSMIHEVLCAGFERVKVMRSRSELDRELLRLNALLDELVRNKPDPESLLQEITQLKDSLAHSKRHVEGEDYLLMKMAQSIKMRERIWNHWRHEIIKLSNMEFILMLQARGFEGKLDYNTADQLLNIRVKPQGQVISDRIQKQISNSETYLNEDENSISERDIRQLSGGEKSYSTACFLFALWTTMTSPIRALDEFDVFMDQVNRDFVIRELIKNARTSQVQFILITPNSIWNSVKYNSDVRIIRLDPPERGQSVIS